MSPGSPPTYPAFRETQARRAERRRRVAVDRALQALDDLRAFRHRTRMGYGAEPDWHRTRENGEQAAQLLERFRADLFAFGRELQLYDP